MPLAVCFLALWTVLCGGIGLTAAEASVEEVLPVFEITDTPVSDIIALLAKTGGFSVLADPLLSSPAEGGVKTILAQTVSVRLEKVTARQALEEVLKKQETVLLWSANGRLARVVGAARAKEIEKTRALQIEPVPKSLASTNLMPEIPAEGVPLQEVLLNLVQESGLNIILDPVVTGRSPEPSGKPKTLPNVDFRLENLTALDALDALIENYGLAFAWNAATSVGRITTLEQRLFEREHPLPSFPSLPIPPAATNSQPLILIDGLPLAEVVPSLCQQLGVPVFFDPPLQRVFKEAGENPGPGLLVEIKLRKANVVQALLTVLEAHGLAFLWHRESGTARVLSRERYAEVARWRRENPRPLPANVGANEQAKDLVFKQVPPAEAIKSLARLAGINLLLPPDLGAESGGATGKGKADIEVNMDFQGLSLRQALLALIENQDLVLLWDSATTIGRVAPQNKIEAALKTMADASDPILALRGQEDASGSVTVEEEPLPEAIEVLAKSAGAKVAFEGGLRDRMPGPDGRVVPWPKIEVRFENTTVGKALAALLGNHGLAGKWDAATKTITVVAVR